MKKEYIIEKNGRAFVLYAGLLDLAHEQGLKAITTILLQIPSEANHHTAIATATVETARGIFTGIGDANPQNVNRQVVGALIRISETRAKARALRDATNLAEALADDPQGDADPREPEGPPAAPDPGADPGADAGAGDPDPAPDADARAYEQALGRWQAASAALDGRGIAHPQPPTGANAATLDKWTARAQEKLAAPAGGRDGDA